jgi:excisionase family DNA binding protein
MSVRANNGQYRTMLHAAETHQDEADRTRQEILSGLSTVEEFAAAMNVSTRTVRRWVAAGELPVVQFGPRTYVHIAASRQPTRRQVVIK